jgi:cell pole-organizing protein PopZ
MEEILASIRRIIADDQEAPPAGAALQPEPASAPSAAASDDILDLAELNAPEPAPTPPAAREPAPEEVPDLVFRDAAAVSEPPAQPEAAAEEFAAPALPPAATSVPILEDLPRSAPPPPPPPMSQPVLQPTPRAEPLVSTNAMSSVGSAFSMLSHTVLTQNARTLEDLVTELLKPMLKGWLDEQLPPLVERLVRAEIERVARGGR